MRLWRMAHIHNGGYRRPLLGIAVGSRSLKGVGFLSLPGSFQPGLPSLEAGFKKPVSFASLFL